MANLEQLHEKQLITEEEYYKRRRLLTAQEKRRKEILAEREKKQRGKKKVSSGKKAVGAVADTEHGKTVEQKKEELKILAEAFASKAISLKLYRDKARAIGLSSDAVRQVESEVGKGNLRVKKYAALKKAFREGKMDLKQFSKKLADL